MDTPDQLKQLVEKSKGLLAGPRLFDLVALEAKGATITDVEGKRFIDFSYMHESVVGHCHPKIVEAIKKQADKLVHYCIAYCLTEPAIQLAEKLVAYMPKNLQNGKLIYCTSGTEACNAGVLLAKNYTQRTVVASFFDAHHGTTGESLVLSTGFPNPQSKTHISTVINVVYMPYPNCYRCTFGLEYPQCDLTCLAYVESMFERAISPKQIAAVIIEPIEIQAGLVIPPESYLPSLEKLCRENDVLLIIDEVFTGFGKSGKFLALEHWDLEPDIICMGKAMGGGMPIAAVISSAKIMDKFPVCIGGAIGSFCGNPVACASALATLETIHQEKLMENAVRVGDHLVNAFKDLAKNCRLIGDVRGRGLLIGVELVRNEKTKKPATKETEFVIREAYKRGLLLEKRGIYGNVLQITPPLGITKELADEALEILQETLQKAGH